METIQQFVDNRVLVPVCASGLANNQSRVLQKVGSPKLGRVVVDR